MSSFPCQGRRHASVPGCSGPSVTAPAAAAAQPAPAKIVNVKGIPYSRPSGPAAVPTPSSSHRIRHHDLGCAGGWSDAPCPAYAINCQMLTRRGEDWRRGISSSAALAAAVLVGVSRLAYTQLCAKHDAEPSALRPHGWRLMILTTHTSTDVADVAMPRVNSEYPLLSGPGRPPNHWTAARTCETGRC